LRCWDAIIRLRTPELGSPDTVLGYGGESAGELASAVEAAAAHSGEAWCFAHNAGFDLTVTSLPMVLCERGWSPEFVHLGDETCVFVLKRKGGRLVITDTWSWLRCGLDTAAGDVGMRKTRLPAQNATLADWHVRCRHDASILDRLISELLDWWDGAELGAFAVTGSSCGWRSLRAKTPPRSVLVGPQQPRTALEREAVYGGRKEVFRVGRFQHRWVDDLDLDAAHLTTVANMPLPVAPIRSTSFGRPPDALQPPDGLGAVCTVRIATQRPVAPVRVGDEVWWPVGEFTTTLTTPELAAVQELGAGVEVLSCQWYRLSDAMAGWGRWALDLVRGAGDPAPKVVRRVAKGWGRSVPGRFALRTSELVRTRQATHLGWHLETGHDLTSGAPLELLTFAGVERTYRKDVDGRDCFPAVLAFVEGYVRAAVAGTLDQIDPELLLQVNTDGWWQLRGPRDGPDPCEQVPWPYTATRRASSRDVTVRGPNHVEAPGDRRLSGVPAGARQNLDGSYAWQDWPGLRWQMMFSRPGEYARPGREMVLQEHYCRRWVLDTGETVPVSVRLTPSGQLRLLPWSRTLRRQPGDVLADHQVPALAALADVDRPWRLVPRPRLARPAPRPRPRPSAAVPAA
jgi:hypothetical protein